MSTNEIGSKIEKLPEHLVPEVMDYVEFLLNKYGTKKPDTRKDKNKSRFDWEGGLSKLKAQFTSTELQHKAADWR